MTIYTVAEATERLRQAEAAAHAATLAQVKASRDEYAAATAACSEADGRWSDAVRDLEAARAAAMTDDDRAAQAARYAADDRGELATAQLIASQPVMRLHRVIDGTTDESYI